jgi:hypothetical protein
MLVELGTISLETKGVGITLLDWPPQEPAAAL